MEDRKTALAIFLSIIVIMIYSEVVMGPYNRPIVVSRPEAAAGTPAAGGPASAGPASFGTAASLSSPAPAAAVPAAEKIPAAGSEPSREQFMAGPITTIESDEVLIKITHLGARLLSYELKPYHTALNKADAVDMVNPLGKTFPLGVYTGGISDAAVMYQLGGVSAGAAEEGGVLRIPDKEPLSLKFTGTLPNGAAITKTLRFSKDDFFFDADVELTAPAPDGSPIWLEWVSFLSNELASERWNPRMFVILNQDDSTIRVPSNTAASFPTDGADKWISFGDNYFITALIPAQSGPNASYWKEGDSYVFRAAGGKTEGKFRLYCGPKSLEFFGDNSFELRRSIDLGWFAFIGQPILIGIELLHNLLRNYGLAIVLLTLLLKTVLLPLTKSSFKSMKAMQDLQPEIKKLRDRIEDSQQLNQATMALFKERGVNPMGGCLPVALQIPIFLGMYNALRTSFHLRHAGFALWVHDLAAPERLVILGVPVPVMILVMGASMLIQQLTTPSSAPPEQQRMMLLMPVMFTVMFIIYPFPSGLVLYWLTNNLISIVQQMALRSERNITPLQATALGSVAIFGGAFLLTLL